MYKCRGCGKVVNIIEQKQREALKSAVRREGHQVQASGKGVCARCYAAREMHAMIESNTVMSMLLQGKTI